jgi:general secretion pathway protein H
MNRSRTSRFALTRGFTLIEVVVVVLILSIMIGMIGVNLSRDQTDVLRDEGRRLVLVMQGARQQAILEGRPYAFAIMSDGYRFLQVDKDGTRLVPVEADELLAPHKLPWPMTLEPQKPKEDMKQRSDLILFDTSGEFSTFTLILAIGELRWYIQGQSDGQISSSAALTPGAA